MDWQTVVQAGQLAAQLDRPEIRILDCRFDLSNSAAGRQAYLAGHLPKARYVDLDHDLAAPISADSGRHPLPPRKVLAEVYGGLGIDADTHVVVYDDQGGAIAARAWWLLRYAGHRHVAILDGGIGEWVRQQKPLEAGDVQGETRLFELRPPLTNTIEIDELRSRLQGDLKNRLVDARDKLRFRGELEPIDPVAGHVPGAVNLPFADCLDASGRFRSSAALRQMWQQVLAGDTSSPVAVMCGSGVTACHLVATARMAGLREPSVYVGSWSEWIRDPARPVATGAADQVGDRVTGFAEPT
ncbi:MAG: sulfurtransferase [Gammaproteobacteria bacterium]|nr:sulfurtransferase [Gammaproteobacteria bacterium]